YDRLGRFQEAIAAYKQAQRLTPGDPEVYVNLGIVYGEVKQYDEAIATFLQALRLKADDVDAHFNLGLAYLYSGDKTAALKECEGHVPLARTRADELRGVVQK